MARTGRYPEIDVYQVAKKALDDFEARHEAKKNAIVTLATMLRKGGWAGVKFDTDDADIPHAQQSLDEIEPVSAAALEGDAVFGIVMQSRLLEEALQSAYAAIPEEIRGAVSPPLRAPAT